MIQIQNGNPNKEKPFTNDSEFTKNENEINKYPTKDKSNDEFLSPFKLNKEKMKQKYVIESYNYFGFPSPSKNENLSPLKKPECILD